MRRNISYLLMLSILIFIPQSFLYSQDKLNGNRFLGSGWSISASGNYVSSAMIELNPFSPDIFERNQSIETLGGYGYGLSLKKRILGRNLWLGISAEYVRIKDDELVEVLENDTSFIKVRVTENLEVLPVEFTFYFNIPTGSETFNLYIGGGLGIYFGDRVRQMLGYQSTTVNRSSFLNIIVLSGFEYFLEKNLSVYLESRFRQGKYRVESTFPISYVTLEGITYPVQDRLNSRIFLDGVKIALGISYHL